uniref:G-protein coupled receptors family 1 profile domain-containing protein n=1 Tax=Panagrolaimus sp. JU765 TaxID=591449 RepID=A0AC34QHB0_9BILA
MFSLVNSHLDTSPNINETWTLSCTKEQDASILHYDTKKDDLADHVIPTIVLVLSIIGIIVNSCFIYFVIIGLKSKALPFKGYSLLLNRSVTDWFVALLTAIFVALRKFDQMTGRAPDPVEQGKSINQTYYVLEYEVPHGRTVFTLLLTVDYWAVAGAYGIMALLPFLAVRYPIFYRTRVTNKVITIIMIVSWLMGAVYSALVVSLSSNNAFNVFNSADDLIQWTVSDKDYVLSIFNLFIVALAFVIGSFSYTSIIIYLYTASSQKGYAGAHLAQMVRMGLNIGAFAATCIVMAGFVSLPLFLKSHIDELDGLRNVSMCEMVIHVYELSYIMAIWTTLAMTGWMLRIILDPIMNIILDVRFRELLRIKILVRSANAVNYKPNKVSAPNFLARNEFIRKCAEMNVIPKSISSPDGHYFRFRSPTEVQSHQEPKQKRVIHIRFDDLVI